MHTLPLGLVGCGNWGRLILRDLVQLGAAVTVVARSATARRNAAEYGAARIVGTLDELIATVPAGVVVATPSETHFATTMALLAALPRVAVFCEKPLTVRAADARELARIAADRVFTMDKWRYHPGVQTLARIARERRHGPLLGIRTERLGWGTRDAAAGAVWHLLPHDLAIVLEILGEVPPLRWSHVQRRGDHVTGATTLLGGEPWVECRVSAHHPQRLRRVQLVCADAVVGLEDGYADALTIASGPLLEGDRAPQLRREPFAAAMPLHAELAAFIAFLRGAGPAPKSSVGDSVAIVERIEQVLAHGR